MSTSERVGVDVQHRSQTFLVSATLHELVDKLFASRMFCVHTDHPDFDRFLSNVFPSSSICFKSTFLESAQLDLDCRPVCDDNAFKEI